MNPAYLYLLVLSYFVPSLGPEENVDGLRLWRSESRPPQRLSDRRRVFWGCTPRSLAKCYGKTGGLLLYLESTCIMS